MSNLFKTLQNARNLARTVQGTINDVSEIINAVQGSSTNNNQIADETNLDIDSIMADVEFDVCGQLNVSQLANDEYGTPILSGLVTSGKVMPGYGAYVVKSNGRKKRVKTIKVTQNNQPVQCVEEGALAQVAIAWMDMKEIATGDILVVTNELLAAL